MAKEPCVHGKRALLVLPLLLASKALIDTQK